MQLAVSISCSLNLWSSWDVLLLIAEVLLLCRCYGQVSSQTPPLQQAAPLQQQAEPALPAPVQEQHRCVVIFTSVLAVCVPYLPQAIRVSHMKIQYAAEIQEAQRDFKFPVASETSLRAIVVALQGLQALCGLLRHAKHQKLMRFRSQKNMSVTHATSFYNQRVVCHLCE